MARVAAVGQTPGPESTSKARVHRPTQRTASSPRREDRAKVDTGGSSRFSVQAKLLALVLLPVIGLVIITTANALDKQAIAEEAEQLHTLVDLSIATGDLLNETQHERGITAGYLSSNGRQFRGELETQHRATDRARVQLLVFVDNNKNTLPGQVLTDLQPALGSVRELLETRERALALDTTGEDTIGYYDTLNDGLIRAVTAISSAGSDADLRTQTIAHLALLESEEYTGRVRALLASVFGADRFADGQLQSLVELITRRDVSFEQFEALADPMVTDLFELHEADDAVIAARQIEARAVENGVAAFDVDAGDWSELMTTQAELLGQVENAQADLLSSGADTAAADARASFRNSIAAALALGSVLVVLGGSILTAIIRQFRHVTDVTAELRANAESLQQSNADLERFAYVASHDLKTPLRGISTLVDFIEEDLDELATDRDDDSDISRNLSRLQDQTDRMFRLIEGILQYSRIQSEEDETPSRLDIAGLVAGLGSDHELDDGAIRYVGPKHVTVEGTTHVEQVIANLVTNAVTHHDRRETLRVDVRAEQTGSGLRVSVEDNGPGIEPQYHHKIFEVFQRLDANGSGTGIGLSIVHRILERRGSRIELDSTPGVGTTFSFLWPERKGALRG